MSVIWSDVPGWFDFQDIYDEVALTTPPHSTIVEIGVGFGRSLLYLAQQVRETGKAIRIVGVDPWPDKWWFHDADYVPPVGSTEEWALHEIQKHGSVYAAFLHNLYHSGLSGLVDIVRVPSINAAAMFDEPMFGAHFVFIDGNHTYEYVRPEINDWWNTGVEWLAGHDYDREGVRRAVDEEFGADVEIRRGTTWIARCASIDAARKESSYE